MKTQTLFLALVLGMGIFLHSQAAQAEDKFGGLQFVPYEGLQVSWPLADNAQIDQNHAVPIYLGLPTKRYYILGRIQVPRAEGVTVVKLGPDNDLIPEKSRKHDCASLAKLMGGNAVLVTGNPNLLKAFKLTKEEIAKTAPLYEYKDKLVLVIQFESEVAGKK